MIARCDAMCSIKEIQERERRGPLHQFELDRTRSAGRRKVADRQRMVKEFRRSAAGKSILESEVRTLRALKATVRYLVENIISDESAVWSQVYEFCFDRFRAVRQDLVIQCAPPDQAVQILLPILRFHLLSNYKAYERSMKDYDAELNHQHTEDLIKQLVSIGHEQSLYSITILPIYVVYNLFSEEALLYFLEFWSRARDATVVSHSMEMAIAALHKNYIKTFRLADQLPLILKLAFYRHLKPLQLLALQVMACAFSSRSLHYPVDHLHRLLLYKDGASLESDCKTCGITLEWHSIVFHKDAFSAASQQQMAFPCWTSLEKELSSVAIADVLLKFGESEHKRSRPLTPNAPE